MQQIFNWKKWSAVVTVICFQSTSFLTQPAHALEAAPVSVSQKSLNLEALKLSVKFGEVVESHAGNGNVIVVQDAHAIPDAQRNIANVIKYVQQEYGVGVVALEGASGDLDPQIFRSFPDKKLLREVMKGYMDAGEIAGGTAAAIFDESATKYQGVEDWDVYEEGLGLYLSAMDKTSAIEGQLSALREKLNKEKEAIYPRALLEVDREIEKFYENAAQLTELIKVLGAIQAPKAGSELEAVWKEVSKQTKDNRLESKDIEVRALAAKVEKVLKSPGAVKAFNTRKQEWMTGQISPEAFALNLQEWAEQSDLNLEMSSDLLGMVRDQQTLKGLEGTKLFRDLENYIREVKTQLTQRQQTDVSISAVNSEMSAIQALDEKNNSLRALTKLSKLELSREEWTNLSGNLVFDAFAALGLKQDDFLFHLAFYLNAEERDQIFFENLTSPESGVPSSNVRIIVAGGFHAEGITSRLKEAGMGYALVMPKINHIPENNSYKAQMRGEVSWKDYFEVENGRIHLYKAFVRATRDRLIGVGGDANVMMMKAWRDQIIRDLSDQGKVNRAAWYTRYMDEVVDDALKHTDADKLMGKVDNFIRGLRGLEKSNQLTSEQIAALLKANMIPQKTATFPSDSTSVAVNPSVDLAAVEEAVNQLQFERKNLKGKYEDAPDLMSELLLLVNSNPDAFAGLSQVESNSEEAAAAINLLFAEYAKQKGKVLVDFTKTTGGKGTATFKANGEMTGVPQNQRKAFNKALIEMARSINYERKMIAQAQTEAEAAAKQAQAAEAQNKVQQFGRNLAKQFENGDVARVASQSLSDVVDDDGILTGTTSQVTFPLGGETYQATRDTGFWNVTKVAQAPVVQVAPALATQVSAPAVSEGFPAQEGRAEIEEQQTEEVAPGRYEESRFGAARGGFWASLFPRLAAIATGLIALLPSQVQGAIAQAVQESGVSSEVFSASIVAAVVVTLLSLPLMWWLMGGFKPIEVALEEEYLDEVLREELELTSSAGIEQRRSEARTTLNEAKAKVAEAIALLPDTINSFVRLKQDAASGKLFEDAQAMESFLTQISSLQIELMLSVAMAPDAAEKNLINAAQEKLQSLLLSLRIEKVQEDFKEFLANIDPLPQSPFQKWILGAVFGFGPEAKGYGVHAMNKRLRSIADRPEADLSIFVKHPFLFLFLIKARATESFIDAGYFLFLRIVDWFQARRDGKFIGDEPAEAEGSKKDSQRSEARSSAVTERGAISFSTASYRSDFLRLADAAVWRVLGRPYTVGLSARTGLARVYASWTEAIYSRWLNFAAPVKIQNNSELDLIKIDAFKALTIANSQEPIGRQLKRLMSREDRRFENEIRSKIFAAADADALLIAVSDITESLKERNQREGREMPHWLGVALSEAAESSVSLRYREERDALLRKVDLSNWQAFQEENMPFLNEVFGPGRIKGLEIESNGDKLSVTVYQGADSVSKTISNLRILDNTQIGLISPVLRSISLYQEAIRSKNKRSVDSAMSSLYFAVSGYKTEEEVYATRIGAQRVTILGGQRSEARSEQRLGDEVRVARIPAGKNFTELLSDNGNVIPLWAVKEIYLSKGGMLSFEEMPEFDNFDDEVFYKETRARQVRERLNNKRAESGDTSSQVYFALHDDANLQPFLVEEFYETITVTYPVDFVKSGSYSLPNGNRLPHPNLIAAVSVDGVIHELSPTLDMTGKAVSFFYRPSMNVMIKKIFEDIAGNIGAYEYLRVRNSSNIQLLEWRFSDQSIQEIETGEFSDILDDLNFEGDPVALAKGFPLSRVIYRFLVKTIDVETVSKWSSEGKVPLLEVSLENGTTYAFSGLNPVMLPDDAMRIQRLLSEKEDELDVSSFRILVTKGGSTTNSTEKGQFLDRPSRGFDEFYANFKRSQHALSRLIFMNDSIPDSRATSRISDEELFSDQLRELVSAMASIHPSVTGAEIDLILEEFVHHKLFKGMVVLDRLTVLINLAQQLKEEAKVVPDFEIYPAFAVKFKDPNFDLEGLLRMTVRSESRMSFSKSEIVKALETNILVDGEMKQYFVERLFNDTGLTSPNQSMYLSEVDPANPYWVKRGSGVYSFVMAWQKNDAQHPFKKQWDFEMAGFLNHFYDRITVANSAVLSRAMAAERGINLDLITSKRQVASMIRTLVIFILENQFADEMTEQQRRDFEEFKRLPVNWKDELKSISNITPQTELELSPVEADVLAIDGALSSVMMRPMEMAGLSITDILNSPDSVEVWEKYLADLRVAITKIKVRVSAAAGNAEVSQTPDEIAALDKYLADLESYYKTNIARSESRLTAQEAQVATDLVKMFDMSSKPDFQGYTADELKAKANEIERILGDKSKFDAFVVLLRNLASDASTMTTPDSGISYASIESVRFAVNLGMGKVMSNVLSTLINKPTIALDLEMNVAVLQVLADSLGANSPLVNLIGALQLGQSPEVRAVFKNAGLLITNLSAKSANAAATDETSKMNAALAALGIPSVGVAKEANYQSLDPNIRGARIIYQLLIAGFLASDPALRAKLETGDKSSAVNEINKLLFQVGDFTSGVVKFNSEKGQLEIVESQLAQYIETLFKAQTAVAVAA